MMSRSGLRAGNLPGRRAGLVGGQDQAGDRPGLMGGRGRQSRPWLNAIAAITLPDRARVAQERGEIGPGPVWIRAVNVRRG